MSSKQQQDQLQESACRDDAFRSEQPRGVKRCYRTWAALGVVILFASVVRIRLLDVPLERDEGEYAYAGQLILQGIPPYAQIYSMKMPGIYAVYAVILLVFGKTHTGIHLGLLIVNVATILLLYLLAKEIFSPGVGVITAAIFAVLSLGAFVDGLSANTEHFVILPAVAGILLLVRYAETRKPLLLFGGAFLLGLSFIIKQHGAAFVVFGGVYLLARHLGAGGFGWKAVVLELAGYTFAVLLPFVVMCLILWRAGVFGKFWFWTFQYAHKYVAYIPLSKGLAGLKLKLGQVVGSAIFIWLLAFYGMISLFLTEQTGRRRWFVFGFTLFSFLAVCPGLYFRSHYFIFLLPSVALLAGAGFVYLIEFFKDSRSKLWARFGPVLLVSFVLLSSVYQQWQLFFIANAGEAVRLLYGENPFPETIVISQYIKEHTNPQDRIVVIGSEPQIYFYADRRAATGHIYMYPLMENHPYALRMQQELVSDVESNQPVFLVFVNVSTSWLFKTDSQNMILQWAQNYMNRYYRKVGIVDIISNSEPVYLWGVDAANYKPRSQCWIAVMRRGRTN
jgi:hypothetical protein